MKKMITVILAAALLCACAVPAGALAGEGTPTTVHVDSARDMKWDTLISVENVSWAAFLDGQGRQRLPMVYEGSVYIPLRTAGEWMGAEVAWDQANQTVTLTSGGEPSYLDMFTPEGQPPMTEEEDAVFLREAQGGAEAELRPDIRIVLDGVEQNLTNARGEPVYPLVIRECVYLPVRNVGELCGKEVMWFRESGDAPGETLSNRIYVYSPMTPEQQTAAADYFAQCAEKYAGIQQALNDLAVAQDLTEETFRGRLEDLKAQVLELRDLPLPGVPILEYDCNAVRHNCGRILDDDIAPYLNPETGLRPDFIDATWQEHRDSFVSATKGGDGMRLLGNAISQSTRLVDALITNQNQS